MWTDSHQLPPSQARAEPQRRPIHLWQILSRAWIDNSDLTVGGTDWCEILDSTALAFRASELGMRTSFRGAYLLVKLANGPRLAGEICLIRGECRTSMVVADLETMDSPEARRKYPPRTCDESPRVTNDQHRFQ